MPEGVQTKLKLYSFTKYILKFGRESREQFIRKSIIVLYN